METVIADPDIERAERLELSSLKVLHDAADAALRDDLGLQFTPIGSGYASLAAGLAASAITINRVLGLSSSDTERVAEACALYRDRGVARFFLQLGPGVAGGEMTRACEDAGLVKARGWQKFVRGPNEPLPGQEPGLEIREAAPGSAEAEAFGRIVSDAFDLGAAAAPWIARLPAADGWRGYVAYLDGAPAGAGGLYCDGEDAWTDFGATEPAFRCKGVQRSLLAHRVREAMAAGCARIMNCTGEAVPGEPQHSYSNIKRCGFVESFRRENWAPPKPSAP